MAGYPANRNRISGTSSGPSLCHSIMSSLKISSHLTRTKNTILFLPCYLALSDFIIILFHCIYCDFSLYVCVFYNSVQSKHIPSQHVLLRQQWRKMSGGKVLSMRGNWYRAFEADTLPVKILQSMAIISWQLSFLVNELDWLEIRSIIITFIHLSVIHHPR